MTKADTSEPAITVLLSLGISVLAYKITSGLVPMLGPDLLAKGLGGRDMLKPGYKRPNDDTVSCHGSATSGPTMIPEATGVIGASVYILLLALFAPLPYLAHLLPSASNVFPALNMTSSLPDLSNQLSMDQAIDFPHHSFATYLASLFSLLIATFLGFLDDVFDIRWRFKLPIPIIASVPLLVTYAAGHGVTDVVLPRVFGLRELFGATGTCGVVHLGPLYYLYMSMLSTFCTNSINILAGVNGVEVGQALVIALSIVLNDVLFITLDVTSILGVNASGEPRLVGFGLARGSTQLSDRHLFSLYLMLPLIGVCLGLLKHNWYPSRAFIGDTFCYFSGMAFAVVGILGHFSKTLLLFFVPQVFNFIYSTPQLFGLVPCPRHRLPRLNEKTGLLEPSWAVIPHEKRSKVQQSMLRILAALRVVKIQTDSTTGQIEAVTNLTILNLILVTAGSMREDHLTMSLMGLQTAGSALAFTIRYGVSGFFYDAATRR